MLASVTHILPITLIRRERVLPVPGKVIVRKGQRVNATDTIAEANMNPDHLLLDIGRGLGLTPDEADELIEVQAGAQVAEGDILAGPVGIARRIMRAPRSGKVVLVGNGQVLIDAQTQPFVLKAALPGDVAELIPDRGAILETTGALVQGVWGNGQIDFGLMNVLAKTPDHELTIEQVDVSLRGAMILAGYCGSPEVLKAAAGVPLRGIILGSLEPALASLAARLPLPVLVIEGFGRRPLSSTAYNLLSTNDRREVAVNAEVWDRYAGTRPELVIPLPAGSASGAPHETEIFAAGQSVRIVRAPYAGKVGTVANLCGTAVFPSGIRAQAAEVRLENGDNAVLPLANLEVLA
jgi:hypothetical protein